MKKNSKKTRSKVALITGVTGQDGSYLAELLLKKKYIVHAIKRRSSSFNTKRIDHIYQHPNEKKKKFFLHFGDLTDINSLTRIIAKYKPDEIYNLAAQSHVAVSFEIPIYTAEVNALGTLKLLEAIRNLKLEKKIKFYQASTSELYGKVQKIPQDEKTPFHPMSPYGVAKLFSYWICKNYRESYGMFICNGILFNHESERRGETFVTQKIIRGLVNIALGNEKFLYLGNLDSKRDWGHAKDYVEMQWMMLQSKTPDDYVIATGVQSTVRKFVELTCKKLGIEIEWVGKGLQEKAIVKSITRQSNYNFKLNTTIIKVDKQYYRPSEVNELLGNPSKAQKKLGWKPKIKLDQLISEMLQASLVEEKKLN